MADRIMPRYPIYVPSKGRAEQCLTSVFLKRDGVQHYVVIEQHEYDAYASAIGGDYLLVLPFSNMGSVIPARNWIKEHATAAGYARHWQLDDNMKQTRRWYGGKRIPCESNVALAATEDFADRYENVAIAGLNYTMFAHQSGKQPRDPFWLNVHVYSCTLILNALPNKWRGRYNEDTDMCLQVLAGGWCTVLMNAFMVDKVRTMTMAGGNTASLYKGDGRLKMARSLERMWPGVVATDRRWQRPQHVVKKTWRGFDTPLKLKVDSAMPNDANEYGMVLKEMRPARSQALRLLLDER